MSETYSKSFMLCEKALLLSFALTLCICTWAQGRQSSISSSLIRLHVLAVSDAPEEQALKLRVRDAVLQYLSERMADAGSVDAAEKTIVRELDGIASAAASAAEGRRVTVTLGDERYPTRAYEGFTLPAGRYRSLRVVLGEGQGHNWWCIVYPQVCLPAAEGVQLREAMAGDGYAIITEEEGYELRFRIVELWGEITEKVNSCTIAKKHL